MEKSLWYFQAGLLGYHVSGLRKKTLGEKESSLRMGAESAAPEPEGLCGKCPGSTRLVPRDLAYAGITAGSARSVRVL